MSITRVYFASRELAESLTGNPDMAVISITDPGTPEARLDPQFRHILRLAFFDAIPADEYMPALPGQFDHGAAKQIDDFVADLQTAPLEVSIMVHCEFGISRSAAVALFIEALTGAPLEAREFAYEANTWVLDQLLSRHSGLTVEIPRQKNARERRLQRRA